LTRDQIKVLVEPLKNQQKETSPLQPEAASSLTPVIPSSSLKGMPQLPSMPPDIPQYFLQTTQNQSENLTVVYHPYIIGVAQVRFTDAKTKIDQTKDVVVLTPVTDDPIPVNWDNSQQTNMKISDLQKTSVENVLYADLPSAALKAKNYNIWETDLVNWLGRTQKLELLKSENLNVSSMTGETERDFRIRLQQIAREKRDQEVNTLREKYAMRYAKIDDRLRRTQMDVEEHDAQVRDQKYQTAISIGTTLLGGFLGRKTFGGITKTTRDMSRSMKKKREDEYARENLQSLQQEKEQLESQFQTEVNTLDTKTNPITENLESIVITPTKTNILVRFVALVWTSN
jgi:hypothetical protein